MINHNQIILPTPLVRQYRLDKGFTNEFIERTLIRIKVPLTHMSLVKLTQARVNFYHVG